MSCNEHSTEQLVAHADGELAAVESAAVVRHIATCRECADEVEMLLRTGAMIEMLPRLTPGEDFTQRVVAAARSAQPRPRGAVVRRLWPAATAAAAVLLATVATRVWLTGPDEDGGMLTADEQREIAADLYVLSNLEALEGSDAEELISLVDDLDILEGSEPEVSGLFPDDEDGG